MTVAAPRRWRLILVAAGLVMLLATLGGLLTDLSPWYYALRQPSWKPPDALFGPIWATIFALTAIAGVLAWEQAPDRRQRVRIALALALNAFLNVLWSALFFRFQRPDLALIEVIALWLSIVVLMVVLGKHAPRARWLLAPYLIWVTTAAVLNYSVVALNPS